jgi:4-aminobutyrate aminotransferase-like enzyme
MAPPDLPANAINTPSAGLPLDAAKLEWSAPIDQLRQFMIENSWIEPAIERGLGTVVEDEAGKQYLDLEGGPGVVSVGHCHPEVVAAIRNQADKLLIVPGRYQSRLALNLARRIASYAGGKLKRAFFVNSGAEAVEGAVKLALKHQQTRGRQGNTIIALQHGYHGRLGLSLSLTGLSSLKRGLGIFGLNVGVTHAPAPYCYRCPLGLRYPSCNIRCADAIEDLMHTSVQGDATVMIGEPILGVGGAIVPPKEYWPKVASILRQNGVLLVMDEIFTGFERTGDRFAYLGYGIEPDIVAFGKAIGGGIPIAGFIATEEVGAAFLPGDHSTTFGGKNMIGVAAGHAVLDILDREDLARNAIEQGTRLMEGLRRLSERFSAVGDVRGKGLFVGLELIDGATGDPDAPLAKSIVAEALKEGVLVATTGAYGNVIRITPPLVITSDKIDRALALLEKILERSTPPTGSAVGEKLSPKDSQAEPLG